MSKIKGHLNRSSEGENYFRWSQFLNVDQKRWFRQLMTETKPVFFFFFVFSIENQLQFQQHKLDFKSLNREMGVWKPVITQRYGLLS